MYDETCPMRTPCVHKDITIDDIHEFFSISSPIKIRLVYFNTHNKEILKSSARLRNVNEKCNLVFSKLGDYYYIYNNIFTKVEQLWNINNTNTPARLGNHITIGFDNRGWNIHETLYDSTIDPKGSSYITTRTSDVHYVVKSKTSQLKPVLKTTGKPSAYIESIWNEIVCTPSGFADGGGKHKTPASTPTPTSIRTHISTRTGTNTREVDSIPTNIIAINTITKIRRLRLVADQIGILRIPYIALQKERAFTSQVLGSITNVNLLFIHNKLAMYSYIIINIPFEPVDAPLPTPMYVLHI